MKSLATALTVIIIFAAAATAQTWIAAFRALLPSAGGRREEQVTPKSITHAPVPHHCLGPSRVPTQ